jgi:hypothetical protein
MTKHIRGFQGRVMSANLLAIPNDGMVLSRDKGLREVSVDEESKG